MCWEGWDSLGKTSNTGNTRQIRIQKHVLRGKIYIRAAQSLWDGSRAFKRPENLQKKSNAKNLIIKLGSEGIFIRPQKRYKKNSLKEDKIEAMNLSAKDTAGAGDSLLAVTSMSLATGASIWESSFLGSLAAGIQVGTVGNKVIKKKDLNRELEK